MMRFVRPAMVLVPLVLLASSPAFAQTTPAPTAAESPFSVEGVVGATFGHSSSSNYGAEIGYRINAKWQMFVEAGHMGNITSTDAESRANKLATALGTTANVVQKGNYGDVGVRYRLMDSGRWHPYATTGVGVVSVDTETAFANGSTNVALGSDLSGHVAKTFFVVGAGVTTPITAKVFADLSYRFGRIFPNTGSVENDKAVNTQRLQVGVGFRF